MKNTIITLALMLFFETAFSQSLKTRKADLFFQNLEYVKAIKAYEKLVNRNKGNTYIYSRLAEANFNIFNTIDAEKWYAKIADLPQTNPETVFNYAQMLKANGNYKASTTYMKKFAALSPNDDRAKAFIASPNYLSKLSENNGTFTLTPLPINSEYSDFGGTIANGKLYITSSRNSSNKNYGWNAQPFLDIYQYDITEDGIYENEKILNNTINTKYHEGLTAFTPDGKMMYFSRESFFKKQYETIDSINTKFSVLQLYRVRKQGEGFGLPMGLKINSNAYSVKNPTISADGKTLYFASDMPGGFGKFDIYKAKIYPGGNVGKPLNLGQHINTAGQEMFPFISQSNILYFSSNGHLGLGNLDVFYAKLNSNGAFENATNLAQPINSSNDDFAFSINETTGKGFVSSNRPGGKGDDDIYSFIKKTPPCEVIVQAKIYNRNTNTPIVAAKTILRDSSNNIIDSLLTNAQGNAKYVVNCNNKVFLQITTPNFKPEIHPITVLKKTDSIINIPLDPIDKLIVGNKINLNPIYFPFDKWNITSKAAFELNKLVTLMKKYPEMVIYATSHTDFRGSDRYNEILSDNRVKSTIQYIISQGITTSRISGVGKGEYNPAVACGTKCTEAEHQLNRRSEFTIVSGNPNKN